MPRGSDEVRTGATDDLITDDTLTDLYGIEVRTVTYRQDGNDRRAIVTRYDGGAG